MSILRLPDEILALITGHADICSIFKLGLTCVRLNQAIHQNPYISRIALKKARYSTEAIVANATGDYARGLRRLAKRKAAVCAAEPWAVGIVAMADRFIYTDGHLCYTINKEPLRILDIRQTRTTELVVDVLRLMRHAVRDFNQSLTYTFQPLYCAKGILSCLATQVSGGTTRCWLIIFELKDILEWVVVKRISLEHQTLIRNNKEYLFCITKSHQRIDGSYRWGIQQLDLGTRQWSSEPIILWDFVGSKAGEEICFEIIDDYFYCVSNESETPTDQNLTLRTRFYQALRFPVDQAKPESCEKPLKHHLWRRHDSEGIIDVRWTSLQLSKDENTGDISIVEIHTEWGFEVRRRGNTHVGDNQSDDTIYTLRDCPFHAYNPSCDAFVDLVYEKHGTGHLLKLRVRPKVDIVEQEQTVKLWPGKPHLSQPDDALDQLHDIINPSRSDDGVEWAMDERILVYAPKPASGQLRPITLLAFDPGLHFPGFPNYPFRITNAGYASVVQHRMPELSQGSVCGSPDIVASSPSTGSSGGSQPSGGGEEGTSVFIRSSPPLYQTMSMGDGTQHGFDMSYDKNTAGMTQVL
ncbi:hypothetical protein CDV36_014366 [Fusarium kuroshium]|uniref:F-box domain-containing protein n=1 Tax=Fusarium kuroshium TaxID=2010991 RepID=A0A3M2RI35_9HYPO|nr:hypothetical protein CDV36_014366 [Fusarium kuroshium]